MPTPAPSAAPAEAAVAPAAPPSTVAVVWTSPDSVAADYGRVMRLAGYQAALSADAVTLLKTHIGRRTFFPGLVSPPWQVAGALDTLRADGAAADRLAVCHDNVTTPQAPAGAHAAHLTAVATRADGVRTINLWEEDWVRIVPRAKMAVLYSLFPGVDVPQCMAGANVLHLPTLRTDARCLVGGAMANVCGALVRRPWYGPAAMRHAAMVDLLAVQREVCAGVFTVMDGTFAAEGRTRGGVHPHVKNVLLAGADPVAVDAMAAKLMGLDPLAVPAIREADARGLGVGRPAEITLVGDDIAGVNFRFDGGRAAGAGPRTGLAGLVDAAAAAAGPMGDALRRAYQDRLWHPLIGRQRVDEAMETAWGRLVGEYA